MKQILISESFQWAKNLMPILKQFENDGVSFYEVVAAHADIKNRNNRIYTSDELKTSASSLSERPLNINHEQKKTLPFPENQVLAARYEDGVVECIIQVADPKVNEMIESGEISKVSIEGLYLDESRNSPDTEFPTSLHFKALALLTREDEPGDPLTQIIKDSASRKIMIPGFITEQLLVEAEWSGSYVDSLPDSSFAFVQSGGHKDEQGRTVPRSLRHFPYKDASGKIDPAHVRNALARLSQSALSPQGKAAARKELVAAAKQVGIKTSMDEALSSFRKSVEDVAIALEMSLEAGSDPLTSPSKDHSDTAESSPQNFKGEAPPMEPSSVPQNPEQDRPQMDLPLSANPLASTNEGIKVTPSVAPDLQTALTNATTGVHAEVIPHRSVEESAPKVTNYQIKVRVRK